jgi:hypothetical protein
MKVFIVMENDCGHKVLLSVWGTKRKAEMEVKRLEQSGWVCFILEEEVQ